jgi:hypothetical protein
MMLLLLLALVLLPAWRVSETSAWATLKLQFTTLIHENLMNVCSLCQAAMH